MKAVIVRASTIAKYDRWNPGFFMGIVDAGENIDVQIERAKKLLIATQSRIRNLEAKKKECAAKTAKMIADGEVIPLV